MAVKTGYGREMDGIAAHIDHIFIEKSEKIRFMKEFASDGLGNSADRTDAGRGALGKGEGLTER